MGSNGRPRPQGLQPTRIGRWLSGDPVRFPLSHEILTSIPTEFPGVETGGGARSGWMTDQTTSTTKVRRVDFGDCGPLQPRKSTAWDSPQAVEHLRKVNQFMESA